MTEGEARAWILQRYGAVATEALATFGDMLIADNDRQNLIAPSTIGSLWTRHLLDSGQLIDLAPSAWRRWVDIGSGAGLPGLVVAVLTGRPVTLIEPRRLRVEFLHRCRERLQLKDLIILHAKAENVDVHGPVDVISARAVAKLGVLLTFSRDFTAPSTVFILPKGASAKSEVAVVRRSWHGSFHVKHSIVDPESGIVVASGVAPR